MVIFLILFIILVFSLTSRFLKKTSDSLNLFIENQVEQYFTSKGNKIISITDGYNDPESPFKKEWNLLPSISYSRSHDIFNHRIYKVELINEQNNKSIIWVDCFYFMKYNWWFDTRKQFKT